MRHQFRLPYPRVRTSVKDRLDMIYNVATWEPIELSLGRYKLLWGGFLAWPWSKTFETGPVAYGWMGRAGIHWWGAWFCLMGCAQLWANLFHQSRRARKLVMFVTEPFCVLFAVVFTCMCIFHPLFWWSVGLVWYWSVVIDAYGCLRRLGGLKDDDDEEIL